MALGIDTLKSLIKKSEPEPVYYVGDEVCFIDWYAIDAPKVYQGVIQWIDWHGLKSYGWQMKDGTYGGDSRHRAFIVTDSGHYDYVLAEDIRPVGTFAEYEVS